MSNTVKERLIEYLKAKKVSKSEFGRMIGVSSSYVDSIRKSIDKDKLLSIAKKFPDLNQQWLLYGIGEMLISGNPTIVNESGVLINGDNHNSPIDNRHYYSDSPDVLRAQIEVLEERIKEKDAQIKEKDAQIKEKDAQIKEKDAQIKEKDAQIKSLLTIMEKLKS